MSFAMPESADMINPHRTRAPELVCPAGSLPALKAAVDNGADAVYLGLRDATNARNFPGLNFDTRELEEGIRYARTQRKRVFLAINTYAPQERRTTWAEAVDQAARLKVDAVILADPGLLDYCAHQHPELRRHLSVQASATNPEAIAWYARRFGVQRVVLPRVLSLAQVRQVIGNASVEIEVFGFGSLCIMVEGRCQLSSHVTGVSPNVQGCCSPAHAVRWEETSTGRGSRLNGVLIDRYRPGEHAAYPTICKGRYEVAGHVFYALEEPASLNTLDILPDLFTAGVAAIKIEGRQRSPAYVGQVTRTMRQAIDACATDSGAYAPRAEWRKQLDAVSEGTTHTLGAFYRPWQ